ncbi:hypothetical protein [Kineobactrum salinum]|uniref:Uncharacterized protein n=1 Tax=Kineobactrum salinum TaxID=2708301 RepID=A0A6C0U4Q8_9GAMM|nr:hypothetical protein [Kineobactrum salinum]QIB67132.1 hypothetical protein G3T16_18740 [Kineobactrum salinum]
MASFTQTLINQALQDLNNTIDSLRNDQQTTESARLSSISRKEQAIREYLAARPTYHALADHIACRTNAQMLARFYSAVTGGRQPIQLLEQLGHRHPATINAILNAPKTTLVSIRDTWRSYKRRIPQYTRNLAACEEQLNKLQFERGLAEFNSTGKRTIDLEKLVNDVGRMTGVEQALARVTPENDLTYLRIYTNEIYASDARSDNEYRKDDILIEPLVLDFRLNPARAKLDIDSVLGHRYEAYDDRELIHPHWISDTEPCLGDFGPTITELEHAGDYAGVIEMYIMFLAQFDSEDSAGRYAIRWGEGHDCEHYQGDDPAPDPWSPDDSGVLVDSSPQLTAERCQAHERRRPSAPAPAPAPAPVAPTVAPPTVSPFADGSRPPYPVPVGEQFRMVADEGGLSAGTILTLRRDDTSTCPFFRTQEGREVCMAFRYLTPYSEPERSPYPSGGRPEHPVAVGDMFQVIRGGAGIAVGTIVTLSRDDRSYCPYFNTPTQSHYAISWDALAPITAAEPETEPDNPCLTGRPQGVRVGHVFRLVNGPYQGWQIGDWVELSGDYDTDTPEFRRLSDGSTANAFFRRFAPLTHDEYVGLAFDRITSETRRPYNGRPQHDVTVGDVFEVRTGDPDAPPAGAIVTLIRDDGSTCPFFSDGSDHEEHCLSFDDLNPKLITTAQNRPAPAQVPEAVPFLRPFTEMPDFAVEDYIYQVAISDNGAGWDVGDTVRLAEDPAQGDTPTFYNDDTGNDASIPWDAIAPLTHQVYLEIARERARNDERPYPMAGRPQHAVTEGDTYTLLEDAGCFEEGDVLELFTDDSTSWPTFICRGKVRDTDYDEDEAEHYYHDDIEFHVLAPLQIQNP